MKACGEDSLSVACDTILHLDVHKTSALIHLRWVCACEGRAARSVAEVALYLRKPGVNELVLYQMKGEVNAVAMFPVHTF